MLGFIQLSLSSINFLLPRPNPKTLKHKVKNKKQTRRKPWKTNNNTTPQIKCHGHVPNIIKTTNQAQANQKRLKAQILNIHHDLTPMDLSDSKGNLKPSLLQDFKAVSFSMQYPASYCP